MKLVVFTDLDGTLLDHNNYSFEKAKDALDLLERFGVPLIICSSKTRLEVIEIWHSLKINTPFIVENGAAVFLPKNHFLSERSGWKNFDKKFLFQKLGLSILRLRDIFFQIKIKFDIKSFCDFTEKELIELTGLNSLQVKLAKQREFNEPIWISDQLSNCIDEFEQEVRKAGLNIIRGGRFFHILSKENKGMAVSLVSNLYRFYYKNLITVGLGDSLNDVSMLRQVDEPILVAKLDGTHANVKNSDFIFESKIGPDGWNNAIFKILKSYKII